jgi:secreted protein with Ig-like and vWFA domain
LEADRSIPKSLIITVVAILLPVSFLFAQQNSNKTRTADTIPRKASNITFLLDISNSMGQDNKMLLLKKSTEELLKLLNKKDRIGLISFGNTVNTLYTTSSYSGPDSLINIISRIRSKASATNINGGLFDAYELSMKNMVKPGINQILLITDGEFELNNFSRELVKSNENIVLTCVIIGKGLAAEQAIRYITEELKLKVITLVDEEKDVKRLAEIIENQ